MPFWKKKIASSAPGLNRISRLLILLLPVFFLLPGFCFFPLTALTAGSPLPACDVNAAREKKKKETQKKKSRKSSGKSGKVGPTGAREKKAAAGLSPEALRKKKEKREKALEELEAQILFAASAERIRGMNKLKKLEKDERDRYFPLLRRLSRQDADFQVRRKSIDLLGHFRRQDAEGDLIAALDDSNSEVQTAAVHALGRIKSSRASQHLLRLLQKKDFTKKDMLTVALIDTLGDLKDRSAVPFLEKQVKNDDNHRELRQSILLYFGKAGAVSRVDYLLGIARDEETDMVMRDYAVNSLGKLGVRKVVEPLRKLYEQITSLRDSSERSRHNGLKMQLLTALIRLGDTSLKRYVLAAARDDDPVMRLRAVEQLGEMRLKEARPLLCYKYENDAHKSVRQAARKAINKIDGRAEEDD